MRKVIVVKLFAGKHFTCNFYVMLPIRSNSFTSTKFVSFYTFLLCIFPKINKLSPLISSTSQTDSFLLFKTFHYTYVCTSRPHKIKYELQLPHNTILRPTRIYVKYFNNNVCIHHSHKNGMCPCANIKT